MNFTADAAAQDLTKPDVIELHNIHAKVQMQDKSTVEMSAVTGIYNSKSETLKLDENIVLSSTTGYSGQLSEAMIDIRKGNVVSEQPVEVEMLQGHAQCQAAGDRRFRRAGALRRWRGHDLDAWRCRRLTNQKRRAMTAAPHSFSRLPRRCW